MGDSFKVTFKTDDVRVYLAPPGAGKTHALMDEMVELLKQFRPDEIAFVTFTRKGVANGIDRALAADSRLRAEDLVHFQTLHSMCFKEAGLRHKNIIEPRDIRKFNEMLGFNVTLADSFDNTTEDDKLLQRYDAVRAGSKVGIFLERAYDEERYERLVSAYEAFKEENDLVDFYDCLIRFRDRGLPVPVKCALIDEAQDLTPLQWEVCDVGFSGCKVIRIAGDDYQTLFEYAGADPKILIDLASRYELVKLEKSYRLPMAVYNFARGITAMIQDKVDKDFAPVRDEEGFVKVINDRSSLCRIIRDDYDRHGYMPNRWYLLFRNNCFMDDFNCFLDQYVIPYHTGKGFCVADKDVKKVARYLNYRKDGFGSDQAKAVFCATFGITDIDDDFTETNLIPGENRYVIKDYVDKYGIETLSDMVSSPPYALVATPHRVKGGEADYVAVFLDCTRLVSENALVNLDEELRALYVACTRARKGLYLIPSIGRYGLDDIVELVQDAVDVTRERQEGE